MSRRAKWWTIPAVIVSTLFLLAFVRATRNPPFEFTQIPVYRPLINLRVPALEKTATKIAEIHQQLGQLPVPTPLPTGGTIGYASLPSNSDKNPWVRFSWDAPQNIDAVALVPAQSPNELVAPKEFRPNNNYLIRFYLEKQLLQELIIVSETGEPNMRQTLPHFRNCPTIRADSVEIIPRTSLGMPPSFAIGEFYIFDGKRNLAPFAKLNSSGNLSGTVGFSTDYICDDRTSLGLPQINTPHPIVGYSTGAHHSDTEMIWIKLQLPEPQPIDELRYFPIERLLAAGQNTAGFPQELDVQARNPETDQLEEIFHFVNDQGDSPGLNAVPMRFSPVMTDLIYLEIRKLWKPTARSAATFAAAEIQLRYRGIPLDCTIEPSATASSVEDAPADPRGNIKRRWSYLGLTDGMSTEGRILHERDWLEQLDQRAGLLIQLNRLTPVFEHLKNMANRFCWRLSAGIPLSLVSLLISWQILSQIRQRRRLCRVRDQLAADLHDDLGSNLGSIFMYVQLFQQQAKDQKNYAPLLGLVQDSLDSLKEMIAFTSPRITKPFPLVTVLENITKTHSGGIETTFTVDPRLEAIDYPPEFRRNLRFFLKEALFNAARHSGANRIDTRIHRRENETPVLEILDNGKGLPDEGSAKNTTLSTLRIRAEEMEAKLEITSTESGTRVRLTLPKPD